MANPGRSDDLRDIAAWTDELRERARVLVNGAPREGCVLYWMRVAVRDHESPALDAAIAAANELNTTAFVYHAVSERYPFASDRHHTFILEGARDVARGPFLRLLGIHWRRRMLDATPGGDALRNRMLRT